MGSVLLRALEILLAFQAREPTVAGVVRDEETSAPLVGAVVELTDLARTAATDGDGRYVLRGVPPGRHSLKVRFLGYGPRTLLALVPEEGQLEINVSLRPDPVRLPTLEARVPPIVRGLDRSDSTEFPDRSLSIAAVRSDPLLAEPDAFQALAGGGVVVSPESPNGIHIRGGASDQTAYLLDGIPVLSPYHTAGIFSAWNPDALAGLQLSSSAPSPAYPDALSGTVSAVTRAPGSRVQSQGSISTTQARLTVDGPLGVAHAGYLVSWRSGLPNVLAPRNEASYPDGDTGDWLATIETPALGGRIRLLGYGSGNELDAAAAAETDVGPVHGSRNLFEWHSRSLGVEWRREFSSNSAHVVAWSATSHAGSTWAAQTGPLDMGARRADLGFLASVEHRSGRATTLAGIRIERSNTSYRLQPDSTISPFSGANGNPVDASGHTIVAAPFAQHTRTLGRRLRLELGASLAAVEGDLYFDPRTRLRWDPSARVTLSASYARLHQFAQSVRNPESVVGNVFPTDLYLGVGVPGIPVARSDQGVVALDYRPFAGLRLGVQGYLRSFDGLLLAAPGVTEPFTTTGFTVGTGAARGVSVDAAVGTAHVGFLASYALQSVRLSYGDSSYVPEYGATHLFEAGAIVFPTSSSSIRIGVTGASGRRTTAVSGGFEWEACNLLDRGCEFRGSPQADQRIGATELPAYLRVDLSVRKDWHFVVRGRDRSVGLFGTVSNLLGRTNILTFAVDPTSGELAPIEMRPLAPLVVGLDWRF
jgi:hypothetical protein